jgi:hypothetical protein
MCLIRAENKTGLFIARLGNWKVDSFAFNAVVVNVRLTPVKASRNDYSQINRLYLRCPRLSLSLSVSRVGIRVALPNRSARHTKRRR